MRSASYRFSGDEFLISRSFFNPAAGSPLRYEDLVGHANAIDQNDKWSHQLIAEDLGRPVEEVAEWFCGQNPRDTKFALDNGIIEAVDHLIMPDDAEFVQVAYKF
jgi:hypothetical protein